MGWSTLEPGVPEAPSALDPPGRLVYLASGVNNFQADKAFSPLISGCVLKLAFLDIPFD